MSFDPKNVHYSCLECGLQYGKHPPGVSTWYEETCDICGEIKSCTEIRDFGYLKTDDCRLTLSDLIKLYEI